VCLNSLPTNQWSIYKERWVIVRTKAREQGERRQMEKKVEKAKAQWEKKLWHLSKQEFAWRDDAEAAWKQAIKGKPSFVAVSCIYQEEGRYHQKGRPKQGATPDSLVWHVVGTLTIDQSEVEAQIKKGLLQPLQLLQLLH
jgi:hypothetical protein